MGETLTGPELLRRLVEAGTTPGKLLEAIVLATNLGETDKALGFTFELARMAGIGLAEVLEAYDPAAEGLIEGGRTDVTNCRACRARIVFLKTANGRWIPINAETVTLEDTEYVPSRHTTHYATCPEADSFRRQSKGAGA